MEELDLELEFIDQSFGNKQMSLFSKFLKQNTTLESINFTNSIEEDGIIFLADGLKNNINIKYVNLAWNNIDAEKAKWIAEIIKHNHTIEYLDLSYNKIGDDGAKLLADALTYNSSLIKIDLTHNDIGKIGTSYLLDKTNCHFSLQIELALNDC